MSDFTAGCISMLPVLAVNLVSGQPFDFYPV